MIQFGVQGQSPGGGLGAKPPEAERFFHFQKVIVALKWGRRPPQWKILGGGGSGRGAVAPFKGATGGAAEKGGCSPHARPSLDPPLGLSVCSM